MPPPDPQAESKPRDAAPLPHAVLQRRPGRLTLERGTARAQLLAAGMVGILVLGLVAALMLYFLPQAPGFESVPDWAWWIAGAAGLVGLAVMVGLLLRRRATVFDLEARQIRTGAGSIPFEDAVALVLQPEGGRRRDPRAPVEQTLALVLRQPGSDLGEQVRRAAGGLDRGPQRAELEGLRSRLEREPWRLASSRSRPALVQAADRLARELRVMLIDLGHRPLVAWDRRKLARPLRSRLAEREQPPPEPGAPPAGMAERTGDDGPVLSFQQPRRQPLVGLAVNLLMVALLVAVFFLSPEDPDSDSFNWTQLWPLLTALALGLPPLLKSLVGKSRIELAGDRIRVITRSLTTHSREMPVDALRWVLVERLDPSGLVLLDDEQHPAVHIAMPAETAAWTKDRIEAWLAGH